MLGVSQGRFSGNAVAVDVAGSALSSVGGAVLVESIAGVFLLSRTAEASFTAVDAICSHQSCTITGKVFSVQGGLIQELEGWRSGTSYETTGPWSVAGVAAKLANPQFAERAPEEVVAEVEEKGAQLRDRRDVLRRSSVGAMFTAASEITSGCS